MKTTQALARCLSLGPAAALLSVGLSLSSPAWAGDYKALHTQALDLALNGNTKESLKVLRSLEKERLSESNLAQVQLSIGRVLYQQGSYKAAVSEYRKVTPGTDAWFSALEERAWSYMQMGQPDDALAQLKTALSPLFKDKASSESYFLSAYAHLRICDYPALFRDLKNFKDRYRDHVKTWTAAQSFDPAAARSLKEVTSTIQKLNLVEAEAIQRLYMDDNLKAHMPAPSKITKASDELSFPIASGEEKEVWMDEVDNYQVRVSGCPKEVITSHASVGHAEGSGI